MVHPLSVEDRLDIGELLARYGHIVDEQEWHRAGELFTDDCVYDMTDFDMGIAIGTDAVVEMWTGPTAKHPLAHHATNVVITDDDGVIRVISKGIGVGRGGRVGSVTYYDVVAKTEQGWRFTQRSGILRRP
ncbi:MAG: nuclear transport factor 2 family protein [Acidimicrobiales bacterium]|nr:nuclear transport factor 2 family protein [Acidimicrobiales bacterium]